MSFSPIWSMLWVFINVILLIIIVFFIYKIIAYFRKIMLIFEDIRFNSKALSTQASDILNELKKYTNNSKR